MRISDWSSDVCSSDLNYNFTFAQDAANAAALTITPRALTVTADALDRIYGDANPALTYAVGGLGLVNGDTLTGALATVAAQSSIPGNYAITRGTLAASENYSLRFAPGVLTILNRSEEHTSDIQSPMRLSSTVSCFK